MALISNFRSDINVRKLANPDEYAATFPRKRISDKTKRVKLRRVGLVEFTAGDFCKQSMGEQECDNAKVAKEQILFTDQVDKVNIRKWTMETSPLTSCATYRLIDAFVSAFDLVNDSLGRPVITI